MAKRRTPAHYIHDIPGELPEGAREWAPLNTGFMISSIIGFLVSILYVPRFSLEMAASFSIVFFCMFLASMVSMSRASPDAQLAARPIR